MKNLKKEIVKAICEYQSYINIDEVKEVIEGINNSDYEYEDDFYVECNGVEIRVISRYSIESIWEEGLEELLRECYDIPNHLENYIDYDAWVRDCKFDGMGHYFSGYDGSEYESKNYYYFRTN